MRLFWLGEVSPRLATMPRPRGGEWLESEIEALKREGVNILVSLLTEPEMKELDLREEERLCIQKGIQYISFPIPDFSTPASVREVRLLVEKLAASLAAGQRMVIHCRGGIGRASLIAACVLVRDGKSVDESFALIQSARGCSVPDTREQVQWVERFQAFLKAFGS
ncbi:MAG: dual specificity protein phosphatase family protein [Acidobacteria bacterium]|nr:dual specificity protein phosphatase family protein [Acidobacteriota bacterium]